MTSVANVLALLSCLAFIWIAYTTLKAQIEEQEIRQRGIEESIFLIKEALKVLNSRLK